MNRREFLTAMVVTAVWPRVLNAEQAVKPVIGYLDGSSADASAGFVAGFRDGLAELGFTDGRDVLIEHRWADGNLKRLPDLPQSWWRKSQR